MALRDRALHTFGGGQPMAEPQIRLLQATLALLANNGQIGGIHGLAERFQEAGLGHVLGSWISTGGNLPLSEQQVEDVLGDGPLDQISEETALPREQAARRLAEMLPELVDKLTPNGRVPPDGLGDLGMLLGLVMGSER
jgi:uncharacterized protein YidB (DUF937 family)